MFPKFWLLKSGLRFLKRRIVAKGFNTRSLERSISSNNNIECVHAKSVCVETRLRVKVSAQNTHFRVNKFFSVCKKNGWNRVCVEACSCKSFCVWKQFYLSACESISWKARGQQNRLVFWCKTFEFKMSLSAKHLCFFIAFVCSCVLCQQCVCFYTFCVFMSLSVKLSSCKSLCVWKSLCVKAPVCRASCIHPFATQFVFKQDVCGYNAFVCVCEKILCGQLSTPAPRINVFCFQVSSN